MTEGTWAALQGLSPHRSGDSSVFSVGRAESCEGKHHFSSLMTLRRGTSLPLSLSEEEGDSPDPWVWGKKLSAALLSLAPVDVFNCGVEMLASPMWLRIHVLPIWL